MEEKMNRIIIILVTLCIFAGGFTAFSQTGWVGTWVTAQQLTETSNNPPSPGLENNTLRQVVRVTLSGSQIRVLFSNQYGNSNLVINEVHIAASSGGSSINTSTDTVLTFNGSDSVSIPAGQTVWSDTLSYSLTALSTYTISIYFGAAPSDVTGHPGSRTTSYLQSGNAVTNASLSGSTTDHWYILAGIDVAADGTYAAVVTLGDSITDGRGSTTNGNDRWPDAIADRLQADTNTNKVAVLNQGIGGNAVVSGGLGPTALSRFDRDVVEQSGVKWCIILEGVNDIGGGQSAANLINAYSQFIDKAHANNILIYGVPILPFGGSSYDSTGHEATRQEVNDWIRTNGRFDAVIDLDAAVRDSSNPNRLASAYDSGDGFHLNPAGYQKMADSIPLSLLTPVEGTPLPTSVPTPAPTTAPIDTPAPDVTVGDVNSDGAIDIVDALLTAQYYVGLDPQNFNAANADTNCDGSIDIVDALLIAQYYVGLINQFC
jgi:lysophospholipase L1-like esterase